MSTDRAHETFEVYVCDECGGLSSAAPICTSVEHAFEYKAHVVRVVSLDAAVEALRERGEFACGGFEKEAAAFLEAEFGVPQPEQPA